MNRQSKRLLTVTVVTMIVVAGAAAAYWFGTQHASMVPQTQPAPLESTSAVKLPQIPAAAKEPSQDAPPAPGISATTVPAAPPAAATAPAPSDAVAAASGPAPSVAVAGADQAREALRQGQAAMAAKKHVEARSLLSAAIFSGQLPPDLEAKAVRDCNALAHSTILSRDLYEGDAYVLPYICRQGDTLEGGKGINESSKTYVPARLALRINGLRRGEDIRPGQTLKLVKGPFHAIVSKSRFTMDVYLQRDAMEKVFITRLNVGLGRNGSTPLGAFHVQAGGRLERPAWDPPPGSGLRQRILWGEEGYAFGTKGLWISLEGIEAKTSGISDFGIHSTNDPTSIGKANSLGCIRMADDDIDLVYSLLYDGRSISSRVDIVP